MSESMTFEDMEIARRANLPMSDEERRAHKAYWDQHGDEYIAAAEGANVPRPVFHTAADIARMTPEGVDWVWTGYVARNALTELTAKAKAGKTRFLLELIACAVRGEPFLSRRTDRTSVVYLTEERVSTYSGALTRVGLEDCRDLHVLLRQETRRLDWVTVCESAVECALEVGAGLLIVDTLPDWAQIPGDAENDSGAALEAVRPLQDAAAAGLAVVMCRHERKGGGEIGESGRGSNAFAGAVDVLVALKRSNTPGHETRRELQALGRFDETPASVFIELDDRGRYVVLGDSATVEREQARTAILDALPAVETSAITEADLLEACEGVRRSTARNALAELRHEGLIQREKGAGHAGSRSFGYWRTLDNAKDKPPDALSFQTTSPDRASVAGSGTPLRAHSEPEGSPTDKTSPHSL